MKNDFLKMSEQCMENLLNIANALALIETRGGSTEIIYKVRSMFAETLRQIKEDNSPQDNKIDTSLLVREERKED